MKTSSKPSAMFLDCPERDHLWTTFLEAGKKWQKEQMRIRQEVKEQGNFSLDVAEARKMKEEVEQAHAFFAQHVLAHGCSNAASEIEAIKNKTPTPKKGN
jgi:hypothetical protein